jgi:hypothetical protein
MTIFSTHDSFQYATTSINQSRRGGDDKLLLQKLVINSFNSTSIVSLSLSFSLQFSRNQMNNTKTGMVGLMGTAALTKKRMGYTNTKLHGMIAWAGLVSSYIGLYIIYQNKENMGKSHFTTLHSKAGLVVLVGSTMLGMAGGVFLHPDFGIDKQNGLIRTGHKWASRGVLGLAWMATLSGLQTLIGEDDVGTLVMFAAPLLLAAPFTLL